jgi:DNA polymerase-3 subunit alpha
MPAEFVHLHVHSQYSFLTSAVKLGSLPERVKKLGMRAVAVTDHASMFGSLRHEKACRAAGVSPILGAELNVARPGSGLAHLVLLATSREGYDNLVHLVSRGHLESVNESAPSVSFDAVAARSRGLVALSGCLGGLVPQRVLELGPPHASEALAELRDAFEPGHVFVELQDHGFPEQSVVNEVLVKAAKDLGLPLCATNDVHFAEKDDGIAQVYLECVRLGRTYTEAAPLHHGSSEMYLKSPEEMEQAFRSVPEALANTLRVAEMCSGFRLDLGQVVLPQFPVPEGYDTEGYFRHVSRAGLERRFAAFRRVAKPVDETA